MHRDRYRWSHRLDCDGWDVLDKHDDQRRSIYPDHHLHPTYHSPDSGVMAYHRLSFLLPYYDHCTMINSIHPHSEITGKIIGLAMEVHNTLGNGFQEVIYQRALEREFVRNNINFQREFTMEIHYKGDHIGTRRVDFLVNGIVSVELKAVIGLEPVHLAQAINYLEAYHLQIGLLINFGNTKLQFHRLQNKVLTMINGFIKCQGYAEHLSSSEPECVLIPPPISSSLLQSSMCILPH